MEKRIFVVLLFLVVMQLTLVSAITASIGNARMVLYPEVGGLFSTTIDKSIKVENLNDVPINITLMVDSSTPNGLIELVDDEFILQPGEQKHAKFVVKVRKEGTYEGRINVLTTSEDGKTVVPLSSVITVIAKKTQDYQDNGDDNNNDSNDDPIGGVDDPNNIGMNLNWGKILIISTSVLLLIVLLFMIIVLKKRSVKRGKKINGNKKE